MHELYLAAAGYRLGETCTRWCTRVATVCRRWLGPVEPAAAAGGRDVRLDLFRGLALWFIFLDHIPGNVVSWMTVRNFGFSDATEIFVYISGYTAALVYGKAMRDEGLIVAGARILKRAWQIYVAHVFLFVIYAAAILFIAANAGDPQFVDKMGLADFLHQPGFLFIQVLLLRFKPVNMDVLPMYIAVLIAFAPMLWLLLRRSHLALLASAALYALARHNGWAFASYSGNTWYFNPFAWQLLFMFGAWCALGGAARIGGFIRSRAVTAVAAAYLVFALLIVISWRVPALAEAVPAWLGACIYPIDKRNLDVLRIAHFLALAALTVRFIACNHPFLNSALLRPLIRCGMHSLEIFCLGVLLSLMAYAALVQSSDGVAMQALVSAIGIAALIAVATLIAWGASIEDSGQWARAPRPAPAPALQAPVLQTPVLQPAPVALRAAWGALGREAPAMTPTPAQPIV
jgi:hypothetical protein